MKSNKEYLEGIYKRKNEILNAKEKNEFFNIRYKKIKKSPLKIAATFVISLGVTIGVCYCGTIAYQNIWKEPKKYEFNVNQELTEEEKKECLTEEEANKIGTEYLKKVGLEDETILTKKLEKEFLSDKNEWWMASEKASMTIDAKTRRIKIYFNS